MHAPTWRQPASPSDLENAPRREERETPSGMKPGSCVSGSEELSKIASRLVPHLHPYPRGGDECG